MLRVCRHQRELMAKRNRGNLAIHELRHAAKSLEPGSFLGVPRRSDVIVREDRKLRPHDGVQVLFEGGLASTGR